MSQNNRPNQSRRQDAQDILPDSARVSTTSHSSQDDDASDPHKKDNMAHSRTLQHSHSPEDDDTDIHTHSHADDHIKATEDLDNDDLPEEISDEDKETIKKLPVTII